MEMRTLSSKSVVSVEQYEILSIILTIPYSCNFYDLKKQSLLPLTQNNHHYNFSSGRSTQSNIIMDLKHRTIKLFQFISGRSHILSPKLSIAPKQMVPHMPKLEWQNWRMANLGKC